MRVASLLFAGLTAWVLCRSGAGAGDEDYFSSVVLRLSPLICAYFFLWTVTLSEARAELAARFMRASYLPMLAYLVVKLVNPLAGTAVMCVATFCSALAAGHAFPATKHTILLAQLALSCTCLSNGALSGWRSARLGLSKKGYKCMIAAYHEEDTKELHSLPTRMKQLHNWYKQQAKLRAAMFGVRVPREIYHMDPDIMWVDFECLFTLFQKRDLDVQMLSLWTIMKAQQCKLRNKTTIAFLDPVRVNEKTCKGINSNPHDIILHLTKVFLECQDKESILLAYNCEDSLTHHCSNSLPASTPLVMLVLTRQQLVCLGERPAARQDRAVRGHCRGVHHAVPEPGGGGGEEHEGFFRGLAVFVMVFVAAALCAGMLLEAGEIALGTLLFFAAPYLLITRLVLLRGGPLDTAGAAHIDTASCVSRRRSMREYFYQEETTGASLSDTIAQGADSTSEGLDQMPHIQAHGHQKVTSFADQAAAYKKLCAGQENNFVLCCRSQPPAVQDASSLPVGRDREHACAAHIDPASRVSWRRSMREYFYQEETAGGI
ncbi:hypothetical protein BAE44_0008347 [Dichanthelium oligosanthes]|uniref:DUF4220 domain-containing protein n=1 Tax=Dichanthelium oligosanthes TaxID=888268 RepID=A0A1E5VZT1_9POAL|nr:hypothetical protein BAE44_0008347 [Dichanthelium oligosanthes]